MTVRQLLRSTDSAELAEWEAFDRLEPIDHARRAELSAGIVCKTLADIHSEKNAELFAAAAFMQDWGHAWREMPEDVEAARARVSDQVNHAVQALGLKWE